MSETSSVIYVLRSGDQSATVPPKDLPGSFPRLGSGFRPLRLKNSGWGSSHSSTPLVPLMTTLSLAEGVGGLGSEIYSRDLGDTARCRLLGTPSHRGVGDGLSDPHPPPPTLHPTIPRFWVVGWKWSRGLSERLVSLKSLSLFFFSGTLTIWVRHFVFRTKRGTSPSHCQW